MVTKEQLLNLFEYKSDGSLVRRIATNPRAPAGTVSGTPSKSGYLRTTVLGRSYYNHRIVWVMHHGKWPEILDHINGNKQDNRVENLRESSPSQNQHNKATGLSNTSGVKGVSWSQKRKKYRVRIKKEGKEFFIGYFSDIQQAAVEAEKARLLLHGEYANHG